jgi:hypothetical protein
LTDLIPKPFSSPEHKPLEFGSMDKDWDLDTSTPVPYCPEIREWALWQLETPGLYCPAKIVAVNIAQLTVKLECLPGILPGPGTPLQEQQHLQISWKDCAEAFGDASHDSELLFPSEVCSLIIKCMPANPTCQIAKIPWPWALDNSWVHRLEDEALVGQDFNPADALSPGKGSLLVHLQFALP